MDWVEPLTVRPLQRLEFFRVMDWAREEGWNPGLNDAGIFWQTDPDGYLGAELDGEIVAAGSVVSYGGKFGFMGLFIVHQNGMKEVFGCARMHYGAGQRTLQLPKSNIYGITTFELG